MNEPGLALPLADLVLIAHFAFAAFVVLGLLATVAGVLAGWAWVRNPWFRYAHIAAIGIVVAQAWLGVVCPLTTLEMHLRESAGAEIYSGTFIAHWLHRLLFYRAESWVFTAAYTAFGLLVIAVWAAAPPTRRKPPAGRE